MRLPRVRFTVRRMMVAVAAAAFLMYAALLANRSARSLEIARGHRADAASYAKQGQRCVEEVQERESRIAEQLREALEAEQRAAAAGGDAVNARAESDHASRLRALATHEEDALRLKKDEAAHYSTLRAYYKRLEAKHAYAAAHPWLSSDPDPPRP
jgi:hypothetical protein